MANEFGEPWKIENFKIHTVVSDTNNSFIVDIGSFESNPSLIRLVDCVNICAGLTIDEVRQAIALMDQLSETIGPPDKYTKPITMPIHDDDPGPSLRPKDSLREGSHD